MREALQQYVKRVQDLADHVRGNEQATKQSLVGPLFTLLGYDLTDPRECVPEYRVSVTPGKGTTLGDHWVPPGRLQRELLDHPHRSGELAGLACVRVVTAD